MPYRVPKHIWRTTDDRLVPHEDPEAAFLAYPAGTELSDAEAKKAGVAGVYPGTKSVRKQRSKSQDKPISGLTINRANEKEQG